MSRTRFFSSTTYSFHITEGEDATAFSLRENDYTESLEDLIETFYEKNNTVSPEIVKIINDNLFDLFESVKQLASGDITPDDYFDTGDESKLPTEISQGDLILDLPIINLPSTEVQYRLGMVLSNSCGMSQDKVRSGIPLRVVYAPVVSFAKLGETIGNPQIMSEIKKQQKMQFFYIPESQKLGEDKVVLFDHSLSFMPETPEEFTEKTQLRLSLKAYYHLLIKL